MMNKMMKRIAAAFAAATMMITATSATTVFANDGTGIDSVSGVTCTDYDATLYVAAQSGANVRTAPSTDGRILHALSYGQKVTVCGKTSNGWYQLRAEDTTYGGETLGYIAGNLLSSTNPTSQNSAAGSGNYTVNVASGYLALRTACAYDSSNEIGKLYSGTKVQYIRAASNGYAYVYAPTLGKYGYVNASYITASGSSDSSTGTYRTVSVASGYLALRNDCAYDSSNEIGKLYTGDQVLYISAASNGYAYVYAPSLDRNGYVNASYLY